MSAVTDYHKALAHYLEVQARQPEEPELPDPELTRAEWDAERKFKEAVERTINDSLRGRF